MSFQLFIYLTEFSILPLPRDDEKFQALKWPKIEFHCIEYEQNKHKIAH